MDSMPFNLGQNICRTPCSMLFHPAMVLLKRFTILINILSAQCDGNRRFSKCLILDSFISKVEQGSDLPLCNALQWLALENQQSPFYVVNEITLRGQNPSLKFCYPLEIYAHLKTGLDLLLLKSFGSVGQRAAKLLAIKLWEWFDFALVGTLSDWFQCFLETSSFESW